MESNSPQRNTVEERPFEGRVKRNVNSTGL